MHFCWNVHAVTTIVVGSCSGLGGGRHHRHHLHEDIIAVPRLKSQSTCHTSSSTERSVVISQ